jgi:DAK2 domain fusion protein YloV
MLFGARGNSGVILSQLFFGVSEGLSGLEETDVKTFCKALSKGVERAYGAVAHPVEGTVLTVAREAAENAQKTVNDDTAFEEFFDNYLSEMKKSLERTPELLAVLKEAGVVDSGGAGLVYITEGFCRALKGEENELAVASAENKKSLDFSKFNENSVMEFGYCTELLLQLQTSKTDIANFSVETLIEYLQTLGDSIVAFKTGSVVKVHVHTLTPAKVLEYCQRYGEFLTVKIENMTLQHGEILAKKNRRVFKKNAKRKTYGIVTVVSGDGMANIMRDMGVDVVIEGGQGDNPSVEDFINAYDATNADTIFVLPNNGNIIMTAKNASELFSGSEIVVVPTKSVGEGYSALSMIDFELPDKTAVMESINQGLNASVTGLISRAIREVELGNLQVKKDDYIGFIDKNILVSNKDKLQTATELLEKLSASDKEFIIAFYGKDTTESERGEFANLIKKAYPRTEFYDMYGGQEVYDFILVLQ